MDEKLLEMGLGRVAGYSLEEQMKYTVNKINKKFTELENENDFWINHGTGFFNTVRKNIKEHLKKIRELRELREQLSAIRAEDNKNIGKTGKEY